MRLYKYKGKETTRRGGKVVPPKSEVSFPCDVSAGEDFTLLRSSNDLRGQGHKPYGEIDWKKSMDEQRREIDALPLHEYNKLKTALFAMGANVHLGNQTPTYKVYTITTIMDFAFDCGWTGELDDLDAPKSERVRKIVAKKLKNLTQPSDDKTTSTKKNSRKLKNPSRKGKAVSRS